MRLFIAIPMSHAMKHSLTEIQKQMARKGYKGSYTRRENLHMTVAFIGEWDDTNLVMKALNRIPIPQLTLELIRLGHFGNLYWAGARENPKLEEYAMAVREELRKESIPCDPHPFLPHITLARRIIAPKDKDIEIPKEYMQLRHVCLMESVREEDGRLIYRELGRVSRKELG